MLSQLMEAESWTHRIHPHERLKSTEDAINSITVEEVNGVTQELCEHLSHIDPAEGAATAIIACAPMLDHQGGILCDRGRYSWGYEGGIGKK